MAMMWMLVATVLFLIRPRSLRRSKDEKPGPSSRPSGGSSDHPGPSGSGGGSGDAPGPSVRASRYLNCSKDGLSINNPKKILFFHCSFLLRLDFIQLFFLYAAEMQIALVLNNEKKSQVTGVVKEILFQGNKQLS